MSVQDPTTHIVAALNQVRSDVGLPPLATPTQAEFDAMKKELEETKKELEETKQELERAKEAFWYATFALKEEYDRLEEDYNRLARDKDPLETMYDELNEENTQLQVEITELTTKEEEEPQPTPAVPAPASPNRPAKLQHWYFCQYLLELDPSKKYYNTFRNKWVNVMNTARGVGGQFQQMVEKINSIAIRDLQKMINQLEILHNSFQYPVVDDAVQYLYKVQTELAAQNA